MKTLLHTDFHEFETGMFSAPVGPHTEYHFLPEAAPKQGWAVACFGTGPEAGHRLARRRAGRRQSHAPDHHERQAPHAPHAGRRRCAVGRL